MSACATMVLYWVCQPQCIRWYIGSHCTSMFLRCATARECIQPRAQWSHFVGFEGVMQCQVVLLIFEALAYSFLSASVRASNSQLQIQQAASTAGKATGGSSSCRFSWSWQEALHQAAAAAAALAATAAGSWGSQLSIRQLQ